MATETKFDFIINADSPEDATKIAATLSGEKTDYIKVETATAKDDSVVVLVDAHGDPDHYSALMFVLSGIEAAGIDPDEVEVN